MNAVEQALQQALQAAPDNWDLRLELVDKLKARGAIDEAVAAIQQAPSAPGDEAAIQKLVDICSEARQLPVVEPFLSAFVGAKPSSAVGHYLLAKISSKTGNLDKAREHYQTAVALNADLEDGILAAKLSDFGQTIEHSTGQADIVIQELSQAAPAAPAAPVAPAAPASPVTPVAPAAPAAPATPVAPAAVAAPVAPAAPVHPAEPAEPASTVAAPAPLTPPPAPAPAAPAPTPLSAPAEAAPLPPTAQPSAAPASVTAIPAVTGDVAPPALAVPEAHPAHLAVPEGHDPAPVDYLEPVTPHAHLVAEDGAQMVEYDVSMTDTRRIVLGDPGELPPEVTDVKTTNSKITSIVIAVLAHLVILGGFTLVVMSIPQPNPPQIVASAASVLDDTTMQKQEIEKVVQRKPVQSAQNQMEVMSVAGASAVSMPDITTDLTSFEPIGIGDAFGASMTFDAGDDGGMVSFFGSKSVSKNVVFAVDYSASMRSMDKDKLMRQELAKSLNALPGGIAYQCIFFAGPAWYHGETVSGPNTSPTIKAEKGRDAWKWMSKGGATNFYPEFTEDPEKLPKLELLNSTRSNIRKSVKIVEETKLVWGTDWRWPLFMAMNLEPDTIFFMTDGAWSGSEKILDEILDYNRKHGRAKINTICMMVPQAMEKLQYLADKSRGDCSLVLQDQTVLRGKDLEDFLKNR